MVRQADINNDGSISKEEFIRVMKQKKGRHSFRGELLLEMKKAIKKYKEKVDIKRRFKMLKPHLTRMLE